MSTAQDSQEHQTGPIPITLEIVPADEHDPDPAAISEVARSVVTALKKEDKYTVTPAYTGERGGIELIYQVLPAITSTLQMVGTDIMAQKDTIDVIAALGTIFVSVTPVVERLFRAPEKTPALPAQQASQNDVRVTLKIGQHEIEITSGDMANDERIANLAQRFLAQFPGAHITGQSNVTVRGRVSNRRKSRGKR